MEAAALDRLPEVVAHICEAQRVGSRDLRQRLELVTKSIQLELLKSWEEDGIRFELLRDALEGDGLPLAALSVCGKGTREIRYTQLMRYFLDPSEAHGLGFRVLQAAWKVFECEAVDLESIEPLEVTTEEYLGEVPVESRSRRETMSNSLDIMIRAGDYYLLIEHKIKSPEGVGVSERAGQVDRYDKAIALNCSDIKKGRGQRIYLTPNGREAKGDVAWLPVSHMDLLRGLAPILDDSSLSHVARHNLCDFLFDLMMGPIGIDRQVMNNLKNHVDRALSDPMQSVELKRWCDRARIDWRLLLKILEASYGK